MIKLIAAYIADPSLRNACKVRAYEKAHPMCVCALSAYDMAMMQKAIAFADAKFNREPV